MKKCLALLPLFAIQLTGCSTIDRLNDQVNQSTYSITYNREAVERSTAVIRQNAYLVDESSRSLEENHRLLEAATK